MKIYAIIGLVIIVGVGVLVYYAASNTSEYLDARFIEVENCEVIGDSLDRRRSGYILRKIYQCPDGMIRIR